jgi:hypothetical protein
MEQGERLSALSLECKSCAVAVARATARAKRLINMPSARLITRAVLRLILRMYQGWCVASNSAWHRCLIVVWFVTTVQAAARPCRMLAVSEFKGHYVQDAASAGVPESQRVCRSSGLFSPSAAAAMRGDAMPHRLDAGHGQLVDVACSGLAVAWRRAAQALPDQPVSEPMPSRRTRQRRLASALAGRTAFALFAGLALGAWSLFAAA